MGRKSVLVVFIFLLSISADWSSNAQELDSWELGINYPNDDSSNSFLLEKDGSKNIEFFVDNSGLTDITIQFDYEIPFGGVHGATEEETIAAGTNETFDLKISGVDVHSYEAEKVEKFSISATVSARQGIPDPLSSQQNREGDLEIPVILDLSVEISDPFGPMNAGSDTILTVTVINNGNTQDGVGEVTVEDNCPLLTTDNGLDSLLIGNIEPGKSKDSNLRAMASESHPKRHCDITITITSKRAMNQGVNLFAEDETRVSVEPPPTSVSEPEEEGPEDVEESITSNLSAPGLSISFVGLLFAIIFSSWRDRGGI